MQIITNVQTCTSSYSVLHAVADEHDAEQLSTCMMQPEPFHLWFYAHEIQNIVLLYAVLSYTYIYILYFSTGVPKHVPGVSPTLHILYVSFINHT